MLSIILLVICVSIFIYASMRRPKNFFPGPDMKPFLGNLLEIDINNPNKDFKRLNKEFGDVGLVIYAFNIVILNDIDNIRDMLSSEMFIQKPTVALNTDRHSGRDLGILSAGGGMVMANKRFMLTTLKNFGMGGQPQILMAEDEVAEIISAINDLKGEPFDISHFFALANVSITWRTMGGKYFEKSDPKFIELTEAIHDMPLLISVVGNFSSLLPVFRHLLPDHRKFLKNSNVMAQFVKDEIEEHMKTRQINNPRDFIDAYLDEIEKSTPHMTYDQLVALMADLMLAGSDTTSTLLSFTMLFLALYPEIQEKLYADLCENESCYSKSVYLTAVINETLRLRTPTPVIMAHEAIGDTTLGKYQVPKGALILSHVEEVFSSEAVWGDPDVFRPERFIEGGSIIKLPNEFVPFGRGPRRCLGVPQAKLVSSLFVAHLVNAFRFKLPSDTKDQSTEGNRRFVLLPPEFKLVATPRTD